MNAACGIVSVCLTILASCATVQNPIYQSKAPDVRGGRAFASTIDLVSEVDVVGPALQRAVIGVFYAREESEDGGTHAVLLSVRRFAGFRERAGTINDYDLRESYLLPVGQARQLLEAIDKFIAADPQSLPPTRMISYELDSGISDGRDRPLREINFVIVFSVTSAGKTFKAAFGPSVANLYSTRQTGNQSFDLGEAQVGKLRDALAAALDKSMRPATP